MRLYFCNDEKSISFEEKSKDYQDLKSLLYADIQIDKDLILNDDQIPLLIDHLERNIDLLLIERSSNVMSLNNVERKYKNQVFLLGRNEIDIRLVFLIDFRELLKQSKEVYVYLFPIIKEKIKELHSKLKMDASFIEKLSSDEINELIEHGLVESNDNILSVSHKSKRIPFIF